MPLIAADINTYASERNVKLDEEKCKEMVISFLKYQPIVVSPRQLNGVIERVPNYNLLGVIISQDLFDVCRWTGRGYITSLESAPPASVILVLHFAVWSFVFLRAKLVQQGDNVAQIRSLIFNGQHGPQKSLRIATKEILMDGSKRGRLRLDETSAQHSPEMRWVLVGTVAKHQ